MNRMGLRVQLEMKKSVWWNLSRILPPLVDEFLSHHEGILGTPESAEELHLLRIAGKPLRYAMETFRPFFGKEFKKCLHEVEQVIDLMGKVHDCDVVTAELGLFTQQIRKLNQSGKRGRQRYTVSPISRIIGEEKSKRQKIFEELAKTLRRMKRENFRQRVLDSL